MANEHQCRCHMRSEWVIAFHHHFWSHINVQLSLDINVEYVAASEIKMAHKEHFARKCIFNYRILTLPDCPDIFWIECPNTYLQAAVRVQKSVCVWISNRPLRAFSIQLLDEWTRQLSSVHDIGSMWATVLVCLRISFKESWTLGRLMRYSYRTYSGSPTWAACIMVMLSMNLSAPIKNSRPGNIFDIYLIL